MIEYRPFLNTDPPLIVDLWSRLPRVEGLVKSIDETTLEKHVFSKIYFDRNGFFVALEGDRIVGFSHAGFPPNDELADLNKQCGIVSQLRVEPRDDHSQIRQQLLTLTVEYLRAHGAETIYAGCKFPYSPFYLGLYGGSRHPGILDTDVSTLETFADFGFAVNDQVIIMERSLEAFKTITDRQQMTVRRGYLINASTYPIEQTWWESCTLGIADRERFTVIDKKSKKGLWCGILLGSQASIAVSSQIFSGIVRLADRHGSAKKRFGDVSGGRVAEASGLLRHPSCGSPNGGIR